ncbi:unnamed protein product [Rhizophagus irregularis]|nr:unnamed protein product [Rhizophagus irregularis]
MSIFWNAYWCNGIKTIIRYGSQDLIHLKNIGSEGVYAANWKNTSTIYVIKKFVDNKEVYLTRMADGHQNIIRLYGVTTLDGKEKYSLVLEYAEGGTLRNYLRNNTKSYMVIFTPTIS